MIDILPADISFMGWAQKQRAFKLAKSSLSFTFLVTLEDGEDDDAAALDIPAVLYADEAAPFSDPEVEKVDLAAAAEAIIILLKGASIYNIRTLG